MKLVEFLFRQDTVLRKLCFTMNKLYLTNNNRTHDIMIGNLCGRSKSSRQPIDPSGVFFE